MLNTYILHNNARRECDVNRKVMQVENNNTINLYLLIYD